MPDFDATSRFVLASFIMAGKSDESLLSMEPDLAAVPYGNYRAVRLGCGKEPHPSDR